MNNKSMNFWCYKWRNIPNSHFPSRLASVVCCRQNELYFSLCLGLLIAIRYFIIKFWRYEIRKFDIILIPKSRILQFCFAGGTISVNMLDVYHDIIYFFRKRHISILIKSTNVLDVIQKFLQFRLSDNSLDNRWYFSYM